MSSRQRTITLGPGYEVATQEALTAVLLELGASVDEAFWGSGGSQVLETVTEAVDGRQLTVEAETYFGLAVTGDDDLVTRIGERVATRLASNG